MTKILVAYYSRTGFTQAIARQIAASCGADLESIEDVTGRSGVVGYARSAFEAVLHLEAPIRRAKFIPGDYDLVVIGTPIWFWNVASPVRAYLQRHRRHFRHVAFFCTYGGSGQSKVLGDLSALCGKTAVATLAVCEREVTQELHHDLLARFVANLKRSGRWRGQRRRGQRSLRKAPLVR